ncbi:MAG: ABC transporter substrate-binding protein [Oscillospiraceae bacterium]
MKKLIALLLAAVLCLGLAGCAASSDTDAALDSILSAAQDLQASVENYAAAQAAAAEAAAEAEAAADAPAVSLDEPVNVMVLNGTTGFGMAKLIADANAGEAALDYNVTIETDASNITAALISGDADIAALPTNAAATVYNKTGGGVQMAAINTLGVLYLVQNTENLAIESWEDLDGMTVYVPAQNPTILFKALVNAAGVDVTIDNTYAQPADLRTALAAGEIDLAVLPEPMVTITLSANESLGIAMDLTAEWDAVYPAGSLVQGCVVVRTAFAEEHPDAVNAFLAEYEASIALLSDDADTAAQLIEETGVFAQGAVAKKAIPNCNVCFLAGEEMQAAMDEFAGILFDINPDSIGGAVPAADFYYIAG